MVLWWMAACGGDGGEQGADGDGDGVSVEDGDCDDADAAVAPGVVEVCDGVDQDCDGAVDDDPSDGEPYFADDDADGFGDDDRAISACARPDGYAGRGGDCDDDDPLVLPGFGCEMTIESWSVSCVGERVTFTVATSAEADEVIVYTEETSVELRWSDNHGLEAVDGQAYTFERELTTGASPIDYIRDVSTVFTCDHYEQEVVSYAFFAMIGGAVGDCVLGGQDPASMSGGVGEPADHDWRGCRIAP